MTLHDLIDIPQFTLDKKQKSELLFKQVMDTHNFHFSHCEEYRNVCKTLYPNSSKACQIEELPFLPVSIFKNHKLKSIPDESVYKVLTSSGTTGNIPSSIYLDTDTAKLQTLSLSKIITTILGNQRLPMLIIDSETVLKDRTSFSARGAGILGLSVFGKNHTYVLNEDYSLNKIKLERFLEEHKGQAIFIFGFTFMIWQYLLETTKKSSIDLSNATLLHSGGWKKLSEYAIDNQAFRKLLKDQLNIQNVFNFYGMIEQIGAVFIENELGFLHCANFADIIIRNPIDFSIQEHGKPGLIQVVSPLPKSYPGHSLLTEDIGVCMGEDNDNIPWKGKYFKILGRASKAELRGCSDTFASNLSAS